MKDDGSYLDACGEEGLMGLAFDAGSNSRAASPFHNLVTMGGALRVHHHCLLRVLFFNFSAIRPITTVLYYIRCVVIINCLMSSLSFHKCVPFGIRRVSVLEAPIFSFLLIDDKGGLLTVRKYY